MRSNTNFIATMYKSHRYFQFDRTMPSAFTLSLSVPPSSRNFAGNIFRALSISPLTKWIWFQKYVSIYLVFLSGFMGLLLLVAVFLLCANDHMRAFNICLYFSRRFFSLSLSFIIFFCFLRSIVVFVIERQMYFFSLSFSLKLR